MNRWFWRLYWPAAALAALVFVVGPTLGPTIELAVAPVRADQSITAIERTADRLCWTWTFVKLRGVASTDLDAFLGVNGQEGGVLAPFERQSGRPWGMVRYAVSPRAEPYSLDYCVNLPPYVGPGDRVSIRQTAYYPGFLGLWRLAVPFPDVVDAPPEQ